MDAPEVAHRKEITRVIGAIRDALGADGNEVGTSGVVGYIEHPFRVYAMFHCILDGKEYTLALVPTNMPPLPKE